jgi:hypothetical protein
MADFTFLRNNFSAGEIGPYVMGRTDLPAYANGCKRLENFFPTKIGSVRRRPGSYYLAAATASECRLIRWDLASGDYLVVELSNLEARFIASDGTILASIVTTPWATAALAGVRVANIKGVLYLAHSSAAVRTFTYTPGSPPTVGIATPTFTGVTFSGAGDYPANIAFYAGRLWFQGTTNSPRDIWGSCALDPSSGAPRFHNFTVGSTADTAIHIVETAMGATPLSWLAVMRSLVAGGPNAIWQQSGNPYPGTFDMQIAAAQGSAPVQAETLGNYVIFVGADCRSLFALSYSQEGGGFAATELSVSSRHLLTSGIKEIAAAQAPEPIIWCATNDGHLLSYHLDASAGLAGFACHPMSDALVESVAVARKGAVDRAYIVANRSGTRLLEFIDPGEYTTLGPEDDTSTPGGMHYVDSGIYIKGAAPATTFSGLGHLEGKTVDALGDGAVMPAVTVTDGAVTYSRAVTRIHIGLPMASVLQPTSPEIPTNGAGVGKKRRVEKIGIMLADSYGGKIGRVETELETLPDFVYGVTVYGAAPVLFSGLKEKAFPGTNEADLLVLVEQDEPLPYHVLAIVLTIAVTEH